jgi:hypothetical protein
MVRGVRIGTSNDDNKNDKNKILACGLEDEGGR